MSVPHHGLCSPAVVTEAEAHIFAFVAADRRADDALRNVSIERRQILIARRVGGIAMRVNVPTSSYRGVALSLTATGSKGAYYRLSLVHRDPDLDVELHITRDDRGITAEWQAWSAYFALPRLIEREPRRFEASSARLGAVTIAPPPKPRRRGAILSKRRSRIRLRRKAPLPRPPYVVRNEFEIISYD